MKITTFDIAENTQDEREANTKELAQMKIDAAEFKAKQAEAKAKAIAKAAILDRIGLTVDELQTILG